MATRLQLVKHFSRPFTSSAQKTEIDRPRRGASMGIFEEEVGSNAGNGEAEESGGEGDEEGGDAESCDSGGETGAEGTVSSISNSGAVLFAS